MESASITILEQYVGSRWNLSPEVLEQFRLLYARLERIHKAERRKIFSLTSAVKGEGKTFVAVHLAMTIAMEFGKKTLLMDLDCKKSAMRKLEGKENDQHVGWVDIIQKKADIHEALIPLSTDRFFLLPVGRVNRFSSSSLITSLGTSNLLRHLREQFDYIITDAPPILPLADVKFLEDLVDGVVLVVRAGETTKDMAAKALKNLGREKVIGLVLNDTRHQSKQYYYHYNGI